MGQSAQQVRKSKTEQLIGMPKQITKLVEAESDRGAILILAAYLEEILAAIITGACVSDEEGEKILEFRGPAGGFDLKIQLCKAFALIHPIEVQGLEAVRKIRNCAAHFDQKRGFDVLFDSEQTIDLVANLLKSQNAKMSSREPIAVRTMFVVCVRLLATKLYWRGLTVNRPTPLRTVKETANEVRERSKGTKLGKAISDLDAEAKAGNIEFMGEVMKAMHKAISDHSSTNPVKTTKQVARRGHGPRRRTKS
jgi:hypothetical protein